MDVRNYFLEKFGLDFDEFSRKLAVCPSIVFAGDSGSGKSTVTIDLTDKDMGQLLRNNIGSIQSSKVRNQIVPIAMEGEDKDSIMVIHFIDAQLDIFISNTFYIVSDTIIRTRGEIENEDVEDAIREILNPKGTKAYNISKLFESDNCDALKEKLTTMLRNCFQKLIKNESDDDYLPDVVTNLSRIAKKSNKAFNIRSAYKKEIEKRIENTNFEEMYKVFRDVSDAIKQDIIKKISDLESKSVMVGSKDSDYYIVIDKAHRHEVNEFMKDLYTPSGKETVISHVSYFTSMSDGLRNAFRETMFYKVNTPVVSINDLKGLELGADSVDETIYSIGNIMPDRVIIFHRVKDTIKGFDALLSSIKSQFSKLPIYGVFSFADLTIGDYVREDFGSFNGPGIPVNKTKEPVYYEEAVKRAYEKVKNDVEQYKEALSPIRREANLESYCICSNIPDYVTDIDSVLMEKRLYEKNRFSKLIVRIISETKYRYKTLDLGDESKGFTISINDEKLKKLAKTCVEKHEKRYIPEYYSFRNSNPHWNTVYKWRRMHKIGSGWKSNANVYDNIDIHIGPMVSSFVSKNDITDMLEFSLTGDALKNERFTGYFNENLSTDNEKNKKEMAKQIVYQSFSSDFESTYYSSALDLVREKLSSEEHWYKELKDVMERIIEETKEKTFN
ncbi:hypothetical protein [Lacrimispora amygdalina]|uniref:hypothetical protein n=1 Tax=Lacrimispora amygdalina TaxID=253257 RepID=UPI000BE371DD|nr:hypothetical protein [Lacrimispora amygdalina]